jgi:putative transcriptional regulator
MLKTQSVILEAVNETATGLHMAGVMDKIIFGELNLLCLFPI